MMSNTKSKIAALAARWVVEEGLEYGSAKRRAVKQLALNGRAGLPSNDEVEEEVKAYLAMFCADTQPHELLALRRLAWTWMTRLAAFRPYLTGAVWRGTATKNSDVYIQLFCDDSKSAEIALIDDHVRYEVRSVTGFTGETVDALSVHAFCRELNEEIGVHLMIYDFDDLRGALKPDGQGMLMRGNIQALQNLMESEAL